MKKLLYYSIIALAGLFVASCAKDEEHVIFDPANGTAPTIGAVQGATLSSDGEPLTFTFTLPDFGVASGKTYALFAAATQDFAEPKKVSSTIGADGSVSIKQSDLNSLILNMGGFPEQEFTLYFRVSSWLATDKNVAVESSLKVSNVVSATFVPYDQTILDKDVYEHVWVQGDYCGWSHDKSQFLYNYNKDGKTFSGVIDFGEKAANGIKFTGAGSWDSSTGNWGSEAQAEEAEANSIQLINGDGSQNIICYSKRFYMFSLDKNSIVLTKEWGADVIGVVGTINNWGETPDIAMEYNSDFVRFWADVEIDGDQEIKFRADGAWDFNWGADAKVGGDNIKVSTGKYRVYLDINKGTVEFNENMYGKQEPSAGGDEPEPTTEVWSIIGTINGTAWDTDFDMTDEGNGVWKYSGLTVNDTDEFKFRFAHDWGTSAGGPEANATSTIDPANPYDVYKPEIGTAFDAGTVNIAIQAAGTYDVVYDVTNQKITVGEHMSGWAVIGQVEGSSWDKDFDMKETTKGVWVSDPLLVNGEFKLRFNKSWDKENNRGGSLESLDKPFAVEGDGANIVVPAYEQKYIVTYYADAEAISVHNVSTGWSIIGNINGSSWDQDVYMVQTSENVYSATCKVDSEFKIRFGAEWEVNKGGEFSAIDTPFGVTDGGANIKLEEGTYTITYNAANETITVSQSWGLIGGVFGTSWDADFYMVKDGEGNYVYLNAIFTGDWKIRFNGDWGVNRGGTFAAVDTPFEVVPDGSNINVPDAGLYNVVYKPTDETITVSKAL